MSVGGEIRRDKTPLARLSGNGPARDHEQMVRAARLHFEFGLTHEQAAEVIGVSRVKVTRLIKQARDCGLVQITVASDVGVFTDLESQLCAGGLLKQAIVVPAAMSDSELRNRLATATARYLQQVLRDEMIVAMGLSRTMALVARNVNQPRPVRARFVSMVGSLTEGGPGTGSPYEAIHALATVFAGTAGHLHAPVVVKSAEMARELMDDPSISTTLKQAANADMALVGIGGAEDRIDLTEAGYLSKGDMSQLLASDAVGDIGGRFYDAGGRAVESAVDQRMIGLTLDQYRGIPNRVVAAGGSRKVMAIAAAARGGLAEVLITDLSTAKAVLEELTGAMEPPPRTPVNAPRKRASRKERPQDD